MYTKVENPKEINDRTLTNSVASDKSKSKINNFMKESKSVIKLMNLTQKNKIYNTKTIQCELSGDLEHLSVDRILDIIRGRNYIIERSQLEEFIQFNTVINIDQIIRQLNLPMKMLVSQSGPSSGGKLQYGQIDSSMPNPQHVQMPPSGPSPQKGVIGSQDFIRRSVSPPIEGQRYEKTPMLASYEKEVEKFPDTDEYTLYFSSIVREEHLIHIKDGCICNSNGQLITLSKPYMVIMSPDGRIYIAEQVATGRSHTHHSSLLAGHSVSFAGAIVIKDGKITKLTNQSGHYRLPPSTFNNFTAEMKRQGYTDTISTEEWNTTK